MRWLQRNPSSRNHSIDLTTLDDRSREKKKGKENSEPCMPRNIPSDHCLMFSNFSYPHSAKEISYRNKNDLRICKWPELQSFSINGQNELKRNECNLRNNADGRPRTEGVRQEHQMHNYRTSTSKDIGDRIEEMTQERQQHKNLIGSSIKEKEKKPYAVKHREREKEFQEQVKGFEMAIQKRQSSSPKIAEAWWVPPREEKIPLVECIHEEEILPTTISEELPPPPTVDTSTIEEVSTLTESNYEDDNGCMLTKYNDEVVEDNDKVVRKNPSINSSEAIKEVETIRNGKVTGNDRVANDKDTGKYPTINNSEFIHRVDDITRNKVARDNNQATGNDKVIRNTEAAGDKDKAAIIEDDGATRYDDEAAGETTSTSSSRNESESFMKSQPMMSKMQEHKEEVQTLEILFLNAEAHTIKILVETSTLNQTDHLVNHEGIPTKIRSHKIIACLDNRGLDLSTLAMREENDIEEQLEDISAILVENNCLVNPLEYWDKNMPVAEITFTGPQDGQDI
eukprot:Gb_04239 [translate_table: standard]